MFARLPTRRRQPLVALAVSDAARAGAAGDGRIRDDGARLPHRRRCRRRPDRARRRSDRHRRPAQARGGALRRAPAGGQRMVRPHPLQPAQRQGEKCGRAGHAPAARRPPDTRPTSAMCWRRKTGRWCGFRRSPRPTKRTGSRRSSARSRFRAGRRGAAPGARELGRARRDPPHDRRIQLCRPVAAGSGAARRRHRQARLVPALSAGGIAGRLRARRAELGHRQQGERIGRLQRLHELGNNRPPALSARRAARPPRIPGSEARRARPVPAMAARRHPDRGQELGHAADPGARRRGTPCRRPLPPAGRQGDADARADRGPRARPGDRERLRTPAAGGALARRISARARPLPARPA